MITKNKKSKMNMLRKLSIVPLALAAIFLFAFKAANVEVPVPDEVKIESTLPVQEKTLLYHQVDVKPRFKEKDADTGFREWVSSNIVYPAAAAKNGISGRVITDFTIDTDGSVTNIRVLRGVDPLLDAEVLRVLKASPKWTPGEHEGKKVKVLYNFPFLFTLSEAVKSKAQAEVKIETTGESAQNGDDIQVVISPVKMNVLYLGIENPVSILVSGVPSEKVSATMSNGKITKLPGKTEYIAKPTTVGDAVIEVYVEIDGQKKKVEIMTFRVKMIPTPIVKIGGKSGGNIAKDFLMEQLGLIAVMEDFLFDLRYMVQQFDVVVKTPQGEKIIRSNSPAFTKDQKELFNSLEKGSKVFFTNIVARGPDGMRNLKDTAFTIE